MGHRTADDLIDRILDAVVANPDRVDELKRALRARVTSRDWSDPSPPHPTRRSEVRPAWRGAAPVDMGDDGCWDNVPV